MIRILRVFIKMIHAQNHMDKRYSESEKEKRYINMVNAVRFLKSKQRSNWF